MQYCSKSLKKKNQFLVLICFFLINTGCKDVSQLTFKKDIHNVTISNVANMYLFPQTY